MRYQQLNHNWNADPNSPEPRLGITGQMLQLIFRLNSFQFEQFQEGAEAYLTFHGCHQYSFSPLNDEGYYKGQHRYTYQQLPWGEFYQLFTNWQFDFPPDPIVLHSAPAPANLQHYILFVGDHTLECLAQKWEFELL